MGVLRAYFDESERDECGYLAVAGCLFSAPQLRKFRREWQRLFRPYGGSCHMADLFAGRKQFEGMPIVDRERLADAAGEIVRDRVEHAVVALTKTSQYEDSASAILPVTKAYGICCTTAVTLLGEWLRLHGREERIHYVFETGYSKPGERAEIREFLDGLTSEFIRDAYMYDGHSFEPKSKSLWLQSADLIAWEAGRFVLQRWREHPTPTTTMRPSLARFEKSGKLTLRFLSLEELERAMADSVRSGEAEVAFRRFQDRHRPLKPRPLLDAAVGGSDGGPGDHQGSSSS